MRKSGEIKFSRLQKGDSCALSASCIISQIDFDTRFIAAKDADIFIVQAAVFGKLTKNDIHARCFKYKSAAGHFSSAVHFDRRLALLLLNEYRQTNVPGIHGTQGQIA